jgi:hypothetical protein
MNRWYVYRETEGLSHLFDVFVKLGGGNVTAVAAEYRKDHPRIKADSLRFTDKKPEGMSEAPMPYAVHCRVEPTAANHLTAPWNHRIGAYLTRERAMLAIAEDLDQCGETFGGLFPPTSTKGRSYRIWRAAWTDVTAAESTEAREAEALAIAREACAKNAEEIGAPHTASLYRAGQWDGAGIMPPVLLGVRASMGLIG